MPTNAQLEAFAIYGGRQVEDIYEFIGDRREYGATNHEIMRGIGSLQGATSGGIMTLRDQGLVRDSGEERPGAKGVNQAVWKLGDDRDVVHADRIRKLYKLAAFLGYDVFKQEPADEQ